jgi:hypothetical protein
MKIKNFIQVLEKYDQDMEIYSQSDRNTGQNPIVEIEKVIDISGKKSCGDLVKCVFSDEDTSDAFDVLMIQYID